MNFLESESGLINPAKTTSAIDRPMDELRGLQFALRQFALSDGAPLPAVPLARGRRQAGECLSRIFFRTLGALGKFTAACRQRSRGLHSVFCYRQL